MKVVEISPQNARNCTILKNFLGGACPQTPLAKARSFAARDMPLRGMYIENPRSFEVGPPPLEKSCIRPCVNHNILVKKKEKHDTKCFIFCAWLSRIDNYSICVGCHRTGLWIMILCVTTNLSKYFDIIVIIISYYITISFHCF